MNKYEMVAMITTLAIGSATLVTLVNAWLRYRMRSDSRGMPSSAEQRLARIEQAVEAIAVEVERVSEGQRFTSKVLAERARPASNPVGVAGEKGGSDER